MRRSQLARALIGLAVVVGIGVFGFFGTRLAQGAFEEEYKFNVIVGESGQGLVQGSDVAARGVLIGKVGQITLTDDLRAQIQLVLEPRYQIPSDSKFGIVGKTLFGEKQLEVILDGDPQQAASYIPDGFTVDAPDQVIEVQDVLEDLDNLLGAIDPDDLAVVVNDGLGAFVGQEDSIARAIDQGARATDVFARSLDDQTPGIRDLSLVAESLGPVGDEFNRLGAVLDSGALDTLTANQGRLRFLTTELTRFADKLNVILELTRPDLDRLIVEGDNVTRMLFVYRPELADLIVGLEDYTETIGSGGQSDPGFTGLAAGFQIILQEPVTTELCADAPPEIAAVLPVCEGTEGEPGGGPPAIPLPPAPLLEVPTTVIATPELPTRGGLEDVFGQILGDLETLRLGGAR